MQHKHLIYHKVGYTLELSKFNIYLLWILKKVKNNKEHVSKHIFRCICLQLLLSSQQLHSSVVHGCIWVPTMGEGTLLTLVIPASWTGIPVTGRGSTSQCDGCPGMLGFGYCMFGEWFWFSFQFRFTIGLDFVENLFIKLVDIYGEPTGRSSQRLLGKSKR